MTTVVGTQNMSWDPFPMPLDLQGSVDEPSIIVWALTLMAGLCWIALRRCLTAPSVTPSNAAPEGVWARLYRHLPGWPRRPNVLLLVISPSSSRSLDLHDPREPINDPTAHPDSDDSPLEPTQELNHNFSIKYSSGTLRRRGALHGGSRNPSPEPVHLNSPVLDSIPFVS